jgi:hypothetical protein
MRNWWRNLFRERWEGDFPTDKDGLPIPDWQAAPLYFPVATACDYCPPGKVTRDGP